VDMKYYLFIVYIIYSMCHLLVYPSHLLSFFKFQLFSHFIIYTSCHAITIKKYILPNLLQTLNLMIWTLHHWMT